MMKRYGYLFILPIALAVMMTSCTEKDNDETTNPSSDTRRVEKVIRVRYNDVGTWTGGYKETESLEWNGSIITKYCNSSSWCHVFNYVGDNLSEIVQIKEYDNKVYGRTIFTYADNRISEYERYSSNQPLDENVDVNHTKYKVYYNDYGEITRVTGTKDDGTSLSYQLTWQNGNLMQYVYQSGTGSSEEHKFTYDNKKSWRSGQDVMAYIYGFNPNNLSKKNNPLTREQLIHNNGTENSSTTNYTYTYDGEYVQSYSTIPNSDWTYYIKYTTTSDPVHIYKVTVSGMGNNGIVKGGGEYVSGKTVKLLALPNEGYHFAGWSNGSTSNPLTFTITSDVEYQATFEAN